MIVPYSVDAIAIPCSCALNPHKVWIVCSAPEITTVSKPNRKPASAEVSDHTNRSEEHTSELQSQFHLVCRLLLEKKKQYTMSDNLNPTQPTVFSAMTMSTITERSALQPT